ncbi:mannose-6-phosphate isomerase [Sphingomonas jejuensis]|uniref:Mannose-6-phosphate isomerase n=1 Tax=Sphingomonas jejuensis TaxID=904715 RepID=A0ABX0XP84_9SPHN|nr:class I mannose-6-phosphate isomerase [Sphingomonas jejuensis]NJC34475.1 mannose-6-phosphate isomerase [Sphingomonas jejuensis]
MTAVRLQTHRVEKPWGRQKLWPGFDDAAEGGEPIGEVWFQPEDGSHPELLIKYLFTSERLSIQVHPDDEQAVERGYPRGKSEAWVILDAEPSSTIALGLIDTVSHERLRAAAESGEIEQLVDWKPVAAGDVLYSPAGTVHAIGAGLTLIEVQQNVDLTYRLYDYGRPRELHLDDGIAVSDPIPYVAPQSARPLGGGRVLHVEGPKFVMERWSGAATRRVPLDGGKAWFVPVTGSGTVDGQPYEPGQCWMLEGTPQIVSGEDSDIVFAYTGRTAIAF